MDISLGEEKKELESKLIDLFSKYIIEDSNLYLNFLINEAHFYQNRLIRLYSDKPLFYEKLKHKTHSEDIKKCESKLMDIYENRRRDRFNYQT